MSLELRFTVPGQGPQVVQLSRPRLSVGTLLSNHVILRALGVDPIHAIFEQQDENKWVITDLGSTSGIKINGSKLGVEGVVKIGDTIEIGAVTLTLAESPAEAVPVPPQPPETKATKPATPAAAAVSAKPGASNAATKVATPEGSPADGKTVRRDAAPVGERRAEGAPAEKKRLLFSPREARPSGDVLEVVAFWGDTVLEIDHFHPSIKGYERVTIGDPTKAHFISAGPDTFSSYTLADVSDSGYSLQLTGDMDARVRRGGKVEKMKGGAATLSRRDIAHVKYGAVSYFLMFVTPPALDLPRMGPRDPFFYGLMSVAMLVYFMIVPTLWLVNPPKKSGEKDDIWSIVHVPEKQKEIEKVEEKPKIKLAEVKTPPPPKKEPPAPKQKPVKPVKPVEKEKAPPPPVMPPEKPMPKPPMEKPTAALMKQDVKKDGDNKEVGPPDKAPGKVGPPTKSPGTEGMPSTGAKNPDFKLAGPKTNDALGKSGGVVGSGMGQVGGAIKGNGKASYQGVEGVKNNLASGVNLSKLGVGVGKVLSQAGPGAVYTNFKSSAGGAGGGMGSASKTYGLGGVGNGKSMGLAGTGSAVNNFGSGSGGFGSGQGGTGGLGGAGLGKGFGGGGGGEGGAGGGQGGRGRANVTVPPGDPVVSGGLTAQEIMAVIRANLNQIRHCYEQTLQRSPNTTGKMAVTFMINAGGRVSSASVTNSSISDAMMQGCVTGAIQRWKFPQPRGGQDVTVNYPFVFTPL